MRLQVMCNPAHRAYEIILMFASHNVMLHGCTPGPLVAAGLPTEHLLQLTAVQMLVPMVQWLQLALPQTA